MTITRAGGRFSLVLAGGVALVLVACAVGGRDSGGGGSSRTDGGGSTKTDGGVRGDRSRVPITAEETGEVVRVRWARNERFRELYPTGEAAKTARFEVQHSTTGEWGGEERVLTRQMSQRPAQSMWRYYSEGIKTSVPPLEEQEDYGREEFIHHAPVVGMNHYRQREVIWRAGRVVSEGAWSETASVDYRGRSLPRLPRSLPEYAPGELPALIVSQMVGNTASAEIAAPFSAVGARQRRGPDAWRARFADVSRARGLGSDTGAIGWCIKDLAVRKLVFDDGRSAGTSGRAQVESLPRPTGAYPSWDPAPYENIGAFADDATMSLPDVWWRGVQHVAGAPGLLGRSAAEGRRLQAFVERYGAWDDGLSGPKFVYMGCPFTENGSFETEVLTAKSHLRPIVAESHVIIMGTTATAQIVDEATGTLTAAARFIGWWHETYPGTWIFVEPGLRRQRTRHWMEPNDYPFVGSWQTIDILFDQDVLATQRRLVLATNGRGTDDDALDPRDYPERRHIVFVGPNVCRYVEEAAGDVERVDRVIEVCELLWAFDPAFIIQIGNVGLFEAMRPEQARRLVALAERQIRSR